MNSTSAVINSVRIDGKRSGRFFSAALAKRDLRGHSQIAGWIALAIFLVLYITTVQATPGDTRVYQAEIFRYAQSGAAKAPLLWEFGHLFWRPLAYGLWQTTQPLTSSWFSGNAGAEIAAVLLGINFFSGGVLALLVFAIARKLGLPSWLALAVTAGVILCSVVLNYIHSGTAYLPGLTLHLAGIWLLLKAIQDQQHRLLYATLAGAALALACDFWFVYILSLPTAFTAAAIVRLPGCSDNIIQRARSRVGLLATTLATAAALGFLTFLIGAALCHISTVPQLREWIVSSGHSLSAERRFLRFPTGITRSFFYLGDEGRMLKRFAFGDPYAPVRWPELLIRAGLWKVLLFFAAACAFLWSLTRTGEGRAALLVALAGIIPTLWFALFLFETGQPERYLPCYPALLIAACVFIRQSPKQHVTRWTLGLFFCVVALVNLKAYAIDLRTMDSQSAERLHLINQYTLHGGVALVLYYDDPIFVFAGKQPFSPENGPDALPVYLVMEWKKGELWNAGPSCRILRAWQAGGEAWLSKRLIAPRPEPDWGWVENDHPAVPWTKLSGFFGALEKNSDNGGADGFVRVAPTEKNRLLLRETCGRGM